MALGAQHEPFFPPLITGHRVAGDAVAAAVSEASAGRAGAGDFYWCGIEHRLNAAIVLEPEDGDRHVETIHLATMVALGDCIGALAPPEVGIFYRWPDKISANGAEIGTASFVSGPRDGASAPAWLVTGVDLRIRAKQTDPEPGRTPDITTLWDEGCGGILLVPLLESFARHLNTWIHTYETDGARAVHDAWLTRAEGRGEPFSLTLGGIEHAGTFLGLDESGDLILKTAGGVELISLKDAIL